MPIPLDTRVVSGVVQRVRKRIGGPSGLSLTALIWAEIPQRIVDSGLRRRYFNEVQRCFSLHSAEKRKTRKATLDEAAAESAKVAARRYP